MYVCKYKSIIYADTHIHNVRNNTLHIYNICTLCYNMYTWEAANDDEITIISYDDKECAAAAARLGGL